MASIVLLEDETAYREELAAYLLRNGNKVAESPTLQSFWPLMTQADIAIIDLNLPDGEGYAAVSALRSLRHDAGIILLTARSLMEDKLQGLALGADHYLVKPFKFVELAAIIDALMRRVIVGWRLDCKSHLLISPEGYMMELNASEMILFDLISTQTDLSIDKRTLVEALGFDWISYDLRRLDVLISRFRSRWHQGSGTPLPLKTEHRRGYCFAARIERI